MPISQPSQGTVFERYDRGRSGQRVVTAGRRMLLRRPGDQMACCADTRSTPSRRFSVVVVEEPAQPLAATHPAVVVGCQRRIDQHIPQPLMVSLLVVVLQIL